MVMLAARPEVIILNLETIVTCGSTITITEMKTAVRITARSTIINTSIVSPVETPAASVETILLAIKTGPVIKTADIKT